MAFLSTLSTTSLHRSPALAALLLAAAATACTVDKDLGPLEGDTASSTGQPGDTEEPEVTTTDATTEPEPEPEETTTSTTGGEELDPLCACIDPEVGPEDAFVCDKGSCGLVEAGCKPGTEQHDESGVEGYCLTEDGFTVDEAALDCALDLLIAGEGGVVEFAHHTGSDFFISGLKHRIIQVLPEREALTFAWQYVDAGAFLWEPGVATLKDAAYFEGCKAETDLEAKFWCLTEFSTNTAEPLCPLAAQ